MPTLILIGGLAASGKTTLGREIARITKFAFLDKDTITQPLVEALLVAGDAPGGRDDRQSDLYLGLVRPLEYQTFMDVVVENIKLGVSAIAVAPFLREMTDQAWLDNLQQQIPEAVIHKVWIAPSSELLYERVVSRGADRDRGKLGNWQAYIESCSAILPVDACIRVEPLPTEDASALAYRVLRRG
jgi:predicted kinase